ncbi:retrovirus-related pol polyprotein from transposon TNT 1-94 [Tanacetum coccineum]
MSIDSKMVLIGSEEAAVIALETKAVKAQDKDEVATIAAKKVTSLVNVQSPRRTRLLSEELGMIVKTEMNLKMTQHISWPSILKRLFTLYKAYDGGHVVFRSNLKGKVIGGGSQGNANNSTRNEVSTTRVLELLHLDLFGPSNVQSYRGNFYTLIIVDDHSNYTWVVFLESKDDVLEKFKIVYKKLENLHDCSIVPIENNHRSKFDKLQFRSFCEQHGMSYNLSGPFTSQSSEIVERTHLKLRKMSRAMLEEQSIPKKF